jgi:hypothetical protein
MDEAGLITCSLPVNEWADAIIAWRWHAMASNDLIDEDLPFDSSERSEVELIDHLFGFKAGTAGERKDETKSAAWQRGWADAQKSNPKALS